MGEIAIHKDYMNADAVLVMEYVSVSYGRVKTGRTLNGIMFPRWISIKEFVETLHEHEHIVYAKTELSMKDIQTLKSYDVMRNL